VPDALFAEPRLAAVYDPLDPDRSDLDAYAAIVDELGAESVLDIGCGTGTLACLLAGRGKRVTALDPAGASLAVAAGKAHADAVDWVHGDVGALPEVQVDVAVMTANVAQVFVDEADWRATLAGAARATRSGGWLCFETRDPAREAWRHWNRQETRQRLDQPGFEVVASWVELVDVRLPLVSFRSWFEFEADGALVFSDSTLRFRTQAEITEALDATGFVVEEVRDAPDRPGREWVFMARRR
jgi:SAM-dependent methyltransferase